MLENRCERAHAALPRCQDGPSVHHRHFPPRFGAAFAVLVAVVCSADAALGAGLDPSTPALSVALLGIASQPGDVRSRGAGFGAAVGYRLTDQLGLTADIARLFARAGPFSTFAAGLRAVLDSTPISPYLALSLVKMGPEAITGSGLAARSAAGAEVRLSPALSLGLEGRVLTPLSGGSGTALASGTELVLRMVLFPSVLR
jgi:hypothetical protein